MEFPDYDANVPSMDSHQWLSEAYPKYEFMEGVMWLANKSTAGMFPSYGEVSGFKLDKEDLLNFDDNLDINDLIWDNPEPLPFIVVGLVYLLAMMIVGLAWCCCTFLCCRKKNGKTWFTQQDEENDNRRLFVVDESADRKCSVLKIICNVFMGIWIFLSICILFSAFTMNIAINNSIDDLPDDVNNPIDDAKSYLSITKEQFDAVFVKSYDDLTEVVKKIPVKTELQMTEKELHELKNAVQNTYLDILNSADLLGASYTEGVNALKPQLVKLNSISSQISGIFNSETYANSSQLQKSIKINTYALETRDFIRSIDDVLIEVGKDLKNNATEFGNAIDAIDIDSIKRDIEDLEDGLESAKPYVYNTMWVVLSLLVVIVALILVGTIFKAIRGSKDRGCCKSSATFFNSGMCGIFLSGFLLMMLCLTLFVFSGFLQIVCQGIRDIENTSEDTLTHPNANRADGDYVLPSYDSIVQSCKGGDSAYETFKLIQKYDIEEITKLSEAFREILSKKIAKSEASPPEESLDKDSVTELEQTLENIKTTMSKASEGLKVLLGHSESFLKDVDNKILDNAENFKDSFKNQMNIIKEDIGAVEQKFKLFMNTRIAGGNERRQTPQEEVIRQVDNYSTFVRRAIEFDVGKCDHMYKALDVTIEVFCYKIAFPIAGFWLSITFLLLLYIPVLITILSLRRID